MMQMMWNRARERSEGDKGFTLVELLVVIVIIGILVAIAIPVFLSQREKGWASAVQSDLRNAAPVLETEYADTGSYAGVVLADLNVTEGVAIDLTGLDETTYCIEGTHDNLDDAADVWSLNQATGVVTKTACA